VSYVLIEVSYVNDLCYFMMEEIEIASVFQNISWRALAFAIKELLFFYFDTLVTFGYKM